jgi:uncharacterized membrane protein
MNDRHPDERTQFQVDRIAFFSDAVIAIAITLLILEIKIPPLGKTTTLKELPDHFSEHTKLSLLGMFICFLSIGNLWIRHHELYRHVRNYNNRLIKINLYFLMTIMLLPLSISFAFNEDNPAFLAISVFFTNLALCYLMYYWMVWDIFRSKNKFATMDDKKKLRDMKRQAWMPGLTFLCAAGLCFYGRIRWMLFFPLIPVVAWAIKRWGVKKAPQASSS